ncbi:MAG TPA: N-acyl homoserine lactonase family protein [Solirubrobacteraceae bacterium]
MEATTPVQLPLPGGREGATVRVHPLLTGELLAPPGLLHNSGGPLGGLKALGIGVPKSRWGWIPAPAFLIEHPGAGPLLIDTGLHPDAADRPRAVMGPLANRLYDFRVAAGQTLHEQLRERGVEPADLALIVLTHLHNDHASGLTTFPGIPLVVTAAEWQTATARDAAIRGYSRLHLDRGWDWRTVDHDGAPPYGPFEHGLDLFGDGSVRLLATPGHTAGHQSVLARGRDREVLIAADAAYTRAALSDGVMPGVVGDRQVFRDSLDRIRRFASETPSLVVVPGHDAQAWRDLDPVYE